MTVAHHWNLAAIEAWQRDALLHHVWPVVERAVAQLPPVGHLPLHGSMYWGMHSVGSALCVVCGQRLPTELMHCIHKPANAPPESRHSAWRHYCRQCYLDVFSDEN